MKYEACRGDIVKAINDHIVANAAGILSLDKDSDEDADYNVAVYAWNTQFMWDNNGPIVVVEIHVDARDRNYDTIAEVELYFRIPEKIIETNEYTETDFANIINSAIADHCDRLAKQIEDHIELATKKRKQLQNLNKLTLKKKEQD